MSAPASTGFPRDGHLLLFPLEGRVIRPEVANRPAGAPVSPLSALGPRRHRRALINVAPADAELAEAFPLGFGLAYVASRLSRSAAIARRFAEQDDFRERFAEVAERW